MKLKLDGITLKDVKGNEVLDDKGNIVYLKDQIANILAMDSDPARNGLKMFELARKFASMDEIEIDKADVKLILQAVNSQHLTAILRGSIEELLDKEDKA